MSDGRWSKGRGTKGRLSVRKMMKCLCSKEQLKMDDMVLSSESLATRDYSASGHSSRTAEVGRKPDTGNIEEAESSLRESSCLNYEEARALLGRLEYQRGNVEAALHVFDGIDIAAITPKMKVAIARRVEHRRRRSSSDAAPIMSIHSVSLLFEAIFLKAKSQQDLGKFQEAAQTCKVILDTVESALPDGLPENLSNDCKLQETLNKAVELLPELWKLAGFFDEAILSYRLALLYHWKLDTETVAKLQKEFAIFLLYSGSSASSPSLRSQIEGSFIPKNNIEEAVLLLLILLRKYALKMIEWDPSIIEHLTFALSISGELKSLARQIEGLLPGVLDRRERYYFLALCYLGEGDDLVALDLLKKLLSRRENPNCVKALLLASRICSKSRNYAEEGVSFARKALANLEGGCSHLIGHANCSLAVSFSAQARSAVSDSERITKECEVLRTLEAAIKSTRESDPKIIYTLCLESAVQRKLDVALNYAKQLLRMEAGSNISVWILLAQILSAQKRFVDAESIIDAALDQTGKWDQGELLQTKAKIQIAQGQSKSAIETFSRILAILQVRSKSFEVGRKHLKGGNDDRTLEIETWHNLAYVYIRMSHWRDAEICLSKSEAICKHSSSRWHTKGLLYEAKGLHREALAAYTNALEVEPTHVPSMVSVATILQKLGGRPSAAVRSFLTEALQHDRTNHSAWFHLGQLYKAEGGKSVLTAAECFMAAALLEESAPVEPFR